MESNLLQEIVEKLKITQVDSKSALYSSPKVVLPVVTSLITNLEKQSNQLSNQNFKDFILQAHDVFVRGDSSIRSSILRAIRFSIQNEENIKDLIEEQFHWLIITSFERDGDYNVERIQALKLMGKVLSIAPTLYPISFARSLVAVANSKEDNFRKICVETLRELSLVNPKLVATVNGYSCLLEAVIEPINQELADSILLTVLYLLNDPNIRRFVMPCIDLRVLLSSFTDLDTESSNLTSKWSAAKSAVIIMMRSWVGVVLLTSDEMGLTTLVKMLRDPKVPSATQDIILDVISDILSPADSKLWSSIKGSKLQNTASSSNSLANTGDFFPDRSTPPIAAQANPLTTKTSTQSSGTSISGSTRASNYSFSDFLFSHSSTVDNADLTAAGGPAKPHPQRTKAGSPTNLLSPGNDKRPISFNFSSIFNRASSPTSIGGKLKRGSAPTMPKAFGGKSNSLSTDAIEEVKKPIPTYADPNRYSPIRRRGTVATTNNSNMSTSASNSSLASASSAGNNGNTPINNTIFDPIFNLMDNYVALLCCAFLHVDLIQSLYFLGTHGTTVTATKSRNLMVTYLRVLANILPERRCSELLTIPCLIEFAATTSASSTTNRAHKSSQILVSLAEAFSLMPTKQVSGSHISGLHSSYPLVRVPSDKGVQNSQETYRRGSILSSSTNTNTTNVSNSSQSQTLNHKSNFSPLNIQTIFELAEEIKIASFSNISGANSDFSSTANGATSDVIKSMRSSITSLVDKNDFMKQMEQSKVIGKEGKEPFKWDWMIISDMLEYSFHHPDRLSDALKTKWVRRVCGFYRCSTEEKGYFANLDWEPTNLQYLESASNMYSVLLKDEAGLSFLGSDRRGMLFNEISNEIDSLETLVSAVSIGGQVNNSSIPKNVFRLSSCNTTMAREFFTLLGRILKTTGSRHLLEGTNIFNNLSKIGSQVSLDYLSRLVLTSLSFTDGGFLSRHLLQLWTTQCNCSDQLRLYFHCLLRVLCRSKPPESYNWCVDAIANQLSLDQKPMGLIYKTLEEAIHNKSFLKTIISKKPKIVKTPECQNLLIRFLSIPEGIEYLSDSNWLDSNLTLWQEKGCSDYVDIVEEKISIALSKINNNNNNNTNATSEDSSEIMKAVVPIPIQIPDIMNDALSRQTAYSSSSSSSSFQDNYNDPNSSLSVDLHGLFRMPWNMEIKLTSQAGYQAQGSGGSGNNNTEYLKIDTLLDSSEIVSPFCGETTSDASRILKIRGIVLDAKGAPLGQSIAQNKIISSTLMAGTCPIFRTGRVQSVSDVNIASKRRKGSLSIHQSTTSQMRDNISQTNNRASFSAVSGIVNNDVDDVSVTFQQEHLFDWSHCKPGHRQGNIFELEDSRFAVSVAGEPVIWIFSRRSPALSNKKSTVSTNISSNNKTLNSSAKGSNTDLGNVLFSNNPNRYDFSRSGGFVYLVEVQYFLRLETGQAIFVPMPRHIYGELSRTLEGCAHLAQRNVIFELVSTIHQSKTMSTESNHELRAALWSLGHIGSSDYGFTAILNADPYFVEWCIQNVTTNSNFSLRGTFFYILGLISRTVKGCRKLAQLNWDSAPMGGNSAVAFPKDPSLLFQPLRDQQLTPATNHACFQNNSTNTVLTPFSSSNDIEMEVLNLVAKLPGVIIYRDCRARLEQIKKEKPEVFMRRKLYVEVHKMLEMYTYKLTARRDILNLFSTDAKFKNPKKEEQQ